jgi:SulP family sulfate permease
LIGVLRSYDRSWWRGDLVAGVAVAALIIPKNLGYAGIAGIPLQNGLYAAAVAALVDSPTRARPPCSSPV